MIVKVLYKYVFAAGGEDCFEVDRSSGDVRTTGRPLSPGKEYTLTVQAVDTQGRKGPHASVAILVGLRPPQFSNISYSIYIPESTGVGQALVFFIVPLSMCECVCMQICSIYACVH